MNIDRKRTIHFILVLHMFIFSIIEVVVGKSGCLASIKSLENICFIVFMLYVIKEFFRIKWNLLEKEPMQTFAIEIFADVALLINIFILIVLNKSYDSEKLIIYAGCLWVILFVLKFIQVVLYSEDRKYFFISIIVVFVLGLFNEKNQTIITIVTTLISTVFGRTVLKKLFKSHIAEYEKNNKMKQDTIIDRLEYKLASVNITIILAQIIILITNSLNCLNFIEELDCVEKYIIMGIIRFMILASTYICSLTKNGKKLKEVVFNFLIGVK